MVWWLDQVFGHTVNSKGYKVYLDENYTVEFSNQTTKSYKPTSIYMLSIQKMS